MGTEYAIKHLAKKISSDKPFKPNQWDKKALNTLIEYHNNENSKTERYRGNFLKMYTMCFKIFLSRNKCLKMGQKAMHSILDKPYDLIVSDFTERLNEIERFQWMDEKGFCFDIPANISDKNKRLNEKLSADNLEAYLVYTKGIWDVKEVKSNLINQAQIALNRF